MKTIGLIGGMSWESTQSYYTLLNKGVKERLGGLHSAKILLYSLDFAPIEALQKEGKWNEAGKILSHAAQTLEQAGAELLLLCTNTMHKVAPAITDTVHIPFIHIADATAHTLIQAHKKEVLLLGTRFTMKEAFYKEHLERVGLKVVTPDETASTEVDRIIFEELCLGTCLHSSKIFFLELIKTVHKTHPALDAVIFGCTEIGLLLDPKELSLPAFDTTHLHVTAALNHLFSHA